MQQVGNSLAPKFTIAMTKVTFRKWKGEIIALFPDIPWNPHDYTTSSYMHVGQHGGADYGSIIAASRPATEPQYRDLLAELRAIGYDDLRVVQRARPRFNL